MASTTNLWLINAVSYAINLAVVGGSQRGLWGKDNAEVSDDHPTLVTPAGWAFGIWGVIFLSELIFTIWQSLPDNRQQDAVVSGIGPFFAIANVIQAVWSITFAQELLAVSAVLLVAITASLSVAVIGLASFKKSLSIASPEYWLIHFPIGLHAGWTCAAALVNVNMVFEEMPQSTKVAGLVLSLLAACLAGTVASISFKSQAFLGGVAWAIAGIAAKTDFREKTLSSDVADGINQALQGVWVALIVVGATVVLTSKISAEPTNKAYTSVQG